MRCEKPTSLISILSTDHGRRRREQRDIDKRDLQKALKHGTCESCWGNRWKLEYDGIIFIVDNDKRREITAYPSPLAMASIERKEGIDHERVKEIIQAKPELCHTPLCW
jgi:hypothetical protein